MDATEAKISGMICVGLGSLFVGILPVCFTTQSRQWPVLISALLCFGGGVLLSTSLVHILPELRELTPYAELYFCTGFFILYLVDELVHYFWSGSNHQSVHSDLENQQNQCGHRRTNSAHACYSRNNSNYGAVESHALLAKSESNLYGRQQPYNPDLHKAHSHENLYHEHRQPSQICHVGHTEPCNEPPVGQFGLLLALSIHSILEGLAIGLENSATKVWLLIGAVASHKLVVGFCLGLELSSGISSTPCKHFVSITIFSLGSVAGIGIGMTITGLSNEWSSIALPVLQGLAGGTLLYVTVCEVLPRERARWHNQSTVSSASLIQFISVAFGFVMMTVITKYLDTDHIGAH